jgi:hypothetical protein
MIAGRRADGHWNATARCWRSDFISTANIQKCIFAIDMNSGARDYRLLERWAPKMGGVWSTSDLRSLFDESNGVVLKRRADRLAGEGALSRFSRGFYTTPGFDPDTLAARLNPRSYLSLGTVLARELMIGSVPARTLYCVKTGPARTYATPGLTIVCVGVAAHLFFGFSNRRGVQVATPEKALLDTLYFHLRGRAFSFDLFSDVDVSRLDRKLLASYLGRYQNPRFVRFVEGYLDERS